MFSTFGTWLRGDARGFRDHGHRIHSSGDYRSPPPPAEHAGLRRWVQRVMHKRPVVLDASARVVVRDWLVASLTTRGVQVVALAVASDHVHALVRCRRRDVRRLVGLAKARASLAIGDAHPGTVWGKRCAIKAIRDRSHHVATFRYIVAHSRAGAAVWTYREPAPNPRARGA